MSEHTIICDYCLDDMPVSWAENLDDTWICGSCKDYENKKAKGENND